jgi:death-on-curing protein
MPGSFRWISEEAVLAMHQRQIAEHGGQDGVRGLGLLSSVLARPKNIHAYKPDTDIAELSAAYAFGITKNHPFIDGNKRTSLVVLRTLLIFNGRNIEATPGDKYLTFLKLAEGTLSEEELVDWIRDKLV